MKPSYYDQLGVSDDATVDEIRKACGRAIAKLKPRCDAGDPKAITQVAEFKLAFEVLSSASQRVEYDRSLRNGMMDDDDDEAAAVEYSPPFWNSSRIALAAFFAAAALMIGYYQREASLAEAAAAANAEANRKRGDDLANELKAIKDKERAAAKLDPVAAAKQAQTDEENKRMKEFSTTVNDDAASEALQAERRRARAALTAAGIDPDEVMDEDKDEKKRRREKRLNAEKAAAPEPRSVDDLLQRQNEDLEEQRRKVLRIDPG